MQNIDYIELETNFEQYVERAHWGLGGTHVRLRCI